MPSGARLVTLALVDVFRLFSSMTSRCYGGIFATFIKSSDTFFERSAFFSNFASFISQWLQKKFLQFSTKPGKCRSTYFSNNIRFIIGLFVIYVLFMDINICIVNHIYYFLLFQFGIWFRVLGKSPRKEVRDRDQAGCQAQSPCCRIERESWQQWPKSTNDHFIR